MDDGMDRIHLRPLVAGDKPMLLRWRNQPEIATWMYTDHRITDDEHERWFPTVLEDTADHVYRIVAAGQTPVGMVSLTEINGQRCTWGGYIGDLDWQGRGAGSAAMWLSLHLAFDDLQLELVRVEVLVENTHAVRMYERFGFEHRTDQPKEIVKDDRYFLVLVLELARAVWNTTKTAMHETLKERGLL
jgi:UDP-4-amino-4,6-dideoxy-N-acetyl-beta-L-altrosamine N-acetyltransferase